MPRKAKEKTEELNTKAVTKRNTSKAVTAKKAIAKAEKDAKKTSTKKASTKKTTSTKNSKSKATSSTKKVSVSTKSTKKASTKSSTSKKATTSKKSSTRKSKKSDLLKPIKPTDTIVEYYDLPFRYNQTIVKILAQTPNMLFIYWDISDADRQAFEKQYGENFFEITRPVLIISNTTMNYTFEVEINDFANSWYLHINDANCDYRVELGRRFKTNSNDVTNITSSYSVNEYLYITASNTIEAPNDHILLDKLGKSVFFRNVKTNFIEEKSISSLSYLRNLGRIYNIYDLYKELYKDELILDQLSLDLPSSNSSPTYR